MFSCRIVVLYTLLIVSWVSAAATEALAQNLLSNPDFATNTVGWSGAGVFDGTPAHNHSPGVSGALHSSLANPVAVNTSIGSGTSQCITGIVAGTPYRVAGWINLFPPNPASQGGGAINIQWFTDAACTTFLTQSAALGPTTQSTPPGTYVLQQTTEIAPAGAQSALFMTSVLNNEPGPSTFGVLFDDLLFERASVVAVPTLGGWGFLALLAMMAGVGAVKSARR